MILEKYEPKNFDEVIGNKKQITDIRNWFGNWKRGKVLLLHGSPGSGKTTALRLIGRELGFELVEYSMCNLPFAMIKEDVLKTSKQRSLFFKRKIILIDAIELLKSAKGLSELVKMSEHPIVLIAINPYERNLMNVRKLCNLVKFNKIRADSITNFLIRICEKEGIEYDEKVISQIARMANGDVRAALIDLEVLRTGMKSENLSSLGYREYKDDIFNTLKIIFRSTDLKNISIALMNSDKTLEEIFLWLEENITLEYKDPEEVAKAYDYLSKADIISARIIKRQAFSLYKYCSIAAQGIAVSKKEAAKRYVMYRVPRVFYAKGNNTAAEKIARKLHISKRGVDMQLIRLVAEKDNELLQKFGLDEDEKELIG